MAEKLGWLNALEASGVPATRDETHALIARIRELESGIDSLASTLANVDKAVRETLGIDLDADDALPELVADWMKERAQHAVEAQVKAAWDEAWQMAYNDGLGAGHPLGRSYLDSDKEWLDSDARKAALAAPQPAAVPDGFVLVPKEPTPEMVKAGANSGGLGMEFHEWMGRVVIAWPRMIAAAPATPPAAES